ncbi:MAG: GGDEF domain-containing protein [Desulfobacterales bacterium]|nr:GGDEF domain-containing protein [Desulfobacterales bacterium]
MENKEVEILRNTMTSADQTLLALIGPELQSKAAAIAETFYSHMLHHPESAPFLNHDIVEKKLKASMTQWIDHLFKPRKTREEIDGFIQRQVEVGTRHARINIPLTAINIGTTVLKKEFFRHVVASSISRDRLGDAIILIDEIIDHTMAVINHVYLGELVQDARDRQSLKMHAIGVDMALQTESLRSALFDWHRQILRVLIDPKVNPDKIPSIRKTDFGLWVFHKADLMFPGLEEVVKLKNYVTRIDTAISAAITHRTEGWSKAIETLLSEVDDHVTGATSVLGLITERSLAMETGRDSLTKLFNRRFLRGVLQNEVETSIKTGERFAIIIADIDHFKKINDTYGHDGGDAVLKQMAEILLETVRAGDYVFRYGGEEFLIVVNSVNSIHGLNVAEKLHGAIGRHRFILPGSEEIRITASLGVSIHDGHPDYSRIVSRADEALYEAKQSGRDKCVLLMPE